MNALSRRCVVAVFAVMVIVPIAAASAAFAAPDRAHLAGSSGSGDTTEALAKLVITENGVEFKAADKSAFKPATDGQNLREGDTIRTDATGLAEIDYTDTSYTRLDVDTTFTIKKLTDEKGARQVQGSLDTGRTWNRTATLTESESFEQEGAGANAVVLGTVFLIQCDTPDHCAIIVFDHFVRYSGADNVTKELTTHAACDSKAGVLCTDPEILSISQLASIEFAQENLDRDLAERGLGEGRLRASAYPPGRNNVNVGGVVVSRGPSGSSLSGGIPFTGSSSQTGVHIGVGIALVLMGAVLFVVSKRRREGTFET